MRPFFLVKLDNMDEFDITARLPSLTYLGGKSTPVFNNKYEDNTTRDGSRFINFSVSRSTFTANFLLNSDNYTDQQLLRHEIYQIFGDRKLIRIRASEDDRKVMYVRPSSFDINFISEGYDESLFSIQFEIPSGYKYSLSRSDDITVDDISFGMGFHLNEKPVYTQIANEFRIYNPSDVDIDPYYQRHDMIIKFSFSGDNYKIDNLTTGTSFSYNKPSDGSRTIILSGVTTMLNGQPVSKDTDFGFIKLNKGWNDIKVSGATSHNTTFSFPFIYID